MTAEPAWYEQILEHQLRANPEMWSDLQRHGIGEGSQVRLGFVYMSPGAGEAAALAGFLGEETDYDVDARAQPGEDGGEQWLVVGATQPVAITPEILDEWVAWMVAAGAAEGPCAFDGWTAVMRRSASA